ncbi:ABC transporter permease [Marilutibacter alkalisoli]|uniref:ABC transporter permease n=1 Tax=Marilutibacter alkalisoli TaxID=2591633 RepID=A0A514BQG2_9GAMM|nr:ABC transporter permease [Lysobacter alkalisoli]QDH69259.1 ABC transporter permease [Lysobacter alkalisoli]
MRTFWHALRATLRAVFADRYARNTMIGAVVLYSFLYPAAYRHEVASRLPVAIVDQDRSPMSRDLLRTIDAVRAVKVAAATESVDAAAALVRQGRVEGIVVIPAGFERDILRGGQGQVALYGNGAFLGRASTVLNGVGDAVRGFAMDAARVQARFAGAPTQVPLQLVQRPLFNTREGYGSSIVPGVAELIVHQTLLVGIGVLAGGMRRRRGRRLSWRPVELAGIATAFLLIGAFGLLYYSGLAFWIQDYPRGGNLAGLLVAGGLFLAATVLFGLWLGSFFSTRERAFQYVVATSLVLFMLAHLSWPVTSSPDALRWLAALLPSTPGINAMVRLNQMGASLGEVAPQLWNLAALVVLYGLSALWRYRARDRAGGFRY